MYFTKYAKCYSYSFFCPQMSPFELNDPERFLLRCQKNNFTSHFLSSKENSKEHYYLCMYVSVTNSNYFDTLNFREICFYNNLDKLKINHRLGTLLLYLLLAPFLI